MNDQDKIKQVMQELALRFRDSADTLREIAQRLDEVRRAQEHANRRMEANAGSLERAMLSNGKEFTYREFVEFSSVEEFQRFRQRRPISQSEIKETNWELLEKQLLGEAGDN